jgi:FtsH-binding integral membrane protein
MPRRPELSPGQQEVSMSDFDRNYAASTRGYADRAVIDAGLRAHMIRVYNYMAIGVALTGLVAWFTFQAAATTTGAGALELTPLGQTLFNSPLIWVLMLAPLALVFVISLGINRLSAPTARALFFLYAGLLGLSLSTIFLAFTETSITRVFFISAAAFGGLSLWGYTTQRDLSGFGSFLIMGLIGIIIASLVNIFLKSSGLDWIISVVGVIVFAGLTAWDTQKIKEMYSPMDDGTVAGRKVVMGALSLYLDFINLFLMLLRLVGDRR